MTIAFIFVTGRMLHSKAYFSYQGAYYKKCHLIILQNNSNTESVCYTPETSIMLHGKYTSINLKKNEKIKKKNSRIICRSNVKNLRK